MDYRRIREDDLRSVWHPCMQMKDFESLPLKLITKAKGVYLYDDMGNAYIDSISSWWVNNLGHSNETINAALIKQMNDFEHVIIANFTHEPLVKLATRLSAKTGGHLTKTVFADNGSSAIEAALKLSFHYHKNIGQTRDLFIAFSHSYHGETLGALSAGDDFSKEIYKELLLKTLIAPSPANDSDSETRIAAEELEHIVSRYEQRISAVIIEPLVQCAGNMRMHSPKFLDMVRDICNRHGIHLIFDEIAVGFGRTGRFFAHEYSNAKPDIMCLSKGITGGYLPLSVVMCTDAIYDTFYGEKEEQTFVHSHSYSGNALGCAAANAVLDIFEQEHIIESLTPKIETIAECLEQISQNPRVSNPRQTGMIAAFEVETPFHKPAVEIFSRALQHGVFIRPIQNTVYLMPPLIITPDEIRKIFAAITAVLDSCEE